MSRNTDTGSVLFVCIFIATFTTTAAQLLCVDPIVIGELRVLKSKQCVDIADYSGVGNVHTAACDGSDDQQLIWCGDGTIRNSKAPYNCFTAGVNGDESVHSSTCQVYPSIPVYQKWRFGRTTSFTDTGGIRQEAREIINMKSGRCLDVENYGGHGNIGTYHCENTYDQYFYFRSRGRLLSHGRLQVQRSKHCLDVDGGTSPSLSDNVRIYHCRDSANQYFSFYENGEVVNDKSRMCLDVDEYGGSGNVNMFACEDLSDQKWYRPHQYCSEDYCSFLNRKSGECLDVSHTSAKANANVGTYSCTGEEDQRFRWVAGNWVAPTAAWSLVGCNENGEVTQTISNTISYSTTISESTSVEISASIEAGLKFGGASVTTTVSHSLAKEWTESQEQSQEITFTCQNYGNGKDFTGGCMWQLQMTTRKTFNNQLMVWKPQIVKCSRGSAAPKCPPFTRCLDEACTRCGQPGV